jgi:hypothetical protein
MEIIGQYTPWEPSHTIDTGGSQFWYKDGKLHREDGPAVIFKNGGKQWYKYSKRHREDGPAVIVYNGDKYWFKYDRPITKEVLEWVEKCDIDLDNMSESDKLLLKIFINSIGE